MDLKSGSYRATLVVRSGSRFCKAAAFAPPTSRWESKSDKLGAPKKSTSAPNYAGASTLSKSTLALKYSKIDLMRILKIFSKIKGQDPKAEVSRKWLLKTKIPNVYFEKLYMDCYYFY